MEAQPNSLRCPKCAAVIGVEVAGVHVVMHRGRRIVGKQFSILHEHCGGVWESPELAAVRTLLDTAMHSPAARDLRAALDLALDLATDSAPQDQAA